MITNTPPAPPTGPRTIDILWDEFLRICADNHEGATIRGFARWVLTTWE